MRALACLALAALLCIALNPSAVWAADEAGTGNDAAAETTPTDEPVSGDDTPEAPPAADEPVEPAEPAEEPIEAPAEEPADDPADEPADEGGFSMDEEPEADDGDGDTEDTPEADKGNGSDSKDDAGKKSDKSKSDSESDDDENEDDDDDSVSSWAQKRLDRAQEGIDDSNAAMGEASGALGSLRAAKAAYDEARDTLDGMIWEYDQAVASMDLSKSKSDTARPAAKLAQAELDALDQMDPHTYAVKKGVSVLEARGDEKTLHWIAKNAGAAADAADGDFAESEKTAAELSASIEEQAQVVQDALLAANNAAYAVELACSEARSGENDAKEALDELSEDIEQANDARDDLADVVESHDDARSGIYAGLDEWYDDLDDRAGSEEARLTFGTGLEFTMDEDAFVEKWGAAIDAYYAELGGVPLGGYGKTMAREAWKWKIDPRLCAAVSYTESGGGVACIRNCNAWGWGAADSDPYNLASEWGSWEEAIAAWHEGMGTNGMGLADARAVDELGSTYASAPHWSRNVVEAMKRIEELADAENDPMSSLTLSRTAE